MAIMWFDDFESYDLRTDLPDRRVTILETKTEDPYAGLNRQQRRKAIAVESRAERKKRKKRG